MQQFNAEGGNNAGLIYKDGMYFEDISMLLAYNEKVGEVFFS